MTYLNHTCQGYSHIESEKPCQDSSFSAQLDGGIALAVVSDGHGGKRYFRSDVGSRLITEITAEKIRLFIREFGDRHLKNTDFTARASIKTQIDTKDFEKQDSIDKAFRQLFSSIIYEWNQRVLKHAEENPLTEKELSEMEDSWITDFQKKEKLEKVYGCTLIAAAFMPQYWFAFQIGDGKCFAMDGEGHWSEPIPWDEKCFLNKTTSICDSDAIDEFRYCYEGKGNLPVSIFLGSDGLDDSFGSEENQENFYVQILKSLIRKGKFETEKEIKESLPELSRIGSKDDMSVALIYNEKRLWEMYKTLVRWQIDNLRRHIADQEQKINASNDKIKSISSKKIISQQDEIDLQYARNDEKRAHDEIEKLEQRLVSLKKELARE